VKDIAQKFGN